MKTPGILIAGFSFTLLALFNSSVHAANDEYSFYDFVRKSSASLAGYNWKDINSKTPSVSEISKLRVDAFKIQAFARVLRRAFKETRNRDLLTQSKKMKSDAKFIEDTIGTFLYSQEMHDALQENSSKTASLIRSSQKEYRKAVKSFYLQRKTLQSKAFSLQMATKKVLSYKGDFRELYLLGVKVELRKIRRALDEINPSLHEDGTHELRRKIRWASMYLFYPAGLFGHDDPKAKTNRYTKLTPQPKNQPILIDTEAFLEIGKLIYQLGKSKDEGQLQHYIHFLETGDINENANFQQITDQTQEALIQIKEQNYLERLIESIELADD